MPNSRPTLLLVDGHAYAYRSFFAIRRLTSPDGSPANAIFGFIHAIRILRNRCEPTHLAVIWDGGLDATRTAALPEYKTGRPPMPSDLEKQLDQIIEWLKAMGMTTICRDGVEADDLIATFARQAHAENLPVIIASPDKDFMQLVKRDIQLINPNDKTGTLWSETQVRAKSGVAPEQIVDWLSLVGDAVDTIPGVPGVGPKTAAALLTQFGSIEVIFERITEVKTPRLRDRLVDCRAQLVRNQNLIRLRDDLPCDVKIGEMTFGDSQQKTLHQLYCRWGFRTLLRNLESSWQRDLLRGEDQPSN